MWVTKTFLVLFGIILVSGIIIFFHTVEVNGDELENE